MNINFYESIAKRLSIQKDKQLYRQRKNIQTAQSTRVKLDDGENYLNFSSNDYLGLANHPRLKKRFSKAIEQYGCGSGASHLMSGHTQAHHALEEVLADLKKFIFLFRLN